MKKNVQNLIIFTLFSLLSLSSLAGICLDSLQKMKKQPHRESSRKAFTSCLKEYVQIPTLTQNATEYRAKGFFKKIFSHFSIPYKFFYSKDSQLPQKRFNFIATLSHNRGTQYQWNKEQKAPSIILLSHIDVIHVHPNQWKSPDLIFSGKIQDNALWGRGSLDMKGIAIMQLISFFDIFFSTQKIDHDIHFLAVGGEESNGSGAKGTIRRMVKKGELQSLRQAKIILNEGGGGIYVKQIKKKLFAIDAEQKGGAWLSIANKNLEDLIYDLTLWHFLKLKKLQITPYLPQCQIQSFRTPKAKVNVNPSKLEVFFSCPKGRFSILKGKAMRVLGKYFSDIKLSVLPHKGLLFQSQSSGHGSLRTGPNLLEKVSSLLYSLNFFNTQRLEKALLTTKPSYFNDAITPANNELIKNLAISVLPLAILHKLSFIPLVESFLLKKMSQALKIQNAFRTSCNLTNLTTHAKFTRAYIDCRLLHTFKISPQKNHALYFVNELKKHIASSQSQIHLLSGWNFSISSTENLYFKKMLEAIKRTNPKAITTPFMNIAGSDSTWFRTPSLVVEDNVPAIPSYGFIPLVYTNELISTIHGSDERFPLKNLDHLLFVYEEMVKSLVLSQP